MNLHICIRWGRFMFENGHLFIDEQTGNAKSTVRWMQWRCLFCGRHPHTVNREAQA